MNWQMILTLVLVVLMTLSMIFRVMPTPLSAMLCAVILAIAGIIKPAAAFSPLANTTSVLVVTTGILGAALFNTGVATKLAKAVIKVTGKSETGIMIMIMVVGVTFSAFCSGVSVVLILLPIVAALCSEAEVSVSRMMIPLSFSASIGSCCTTIGGASTVSGVGIAQELGFDVPGFFEWAKLGLPLAVIFLIYMLTVGKKLLVPGDHADPEWVKKYSTKAGDAGSGHTSTQGVITVVIFVAAVIMMFLDLDAFPMFFVAAIGCILLRLTGCMTHKEILGAIDMNTVFIVGGMTAVASGVRESGLGAYLANAAFNALGDHPSKVAVIAVVVVVSCLLTNVLSNTAAVALLVPLFMPMSETLGINPMAIFVAICEGCQFPFLLPMGSGTNSTLCAPGNMSAKDFFRPGIGLTVLCLVGSVIIIPIAWPL